MGVVYVPGALQEKLEPMDVVKLVHQCYHQHNYIIINAAHHQCLYVQGSVLNDQYTLPHSLLLELLHLDLQHLLADKLTRDPNFASIQQNLPGGVTGENSTGNVLYRPSRFGMAQILT